MTTLFSATLALARKLGVARISTATGGTTTTLLDTSRTEGDDAWNGGTIWLITDVGGAGAAPEGEWATVSNFANTGGVFTVSTMTAPGAGDTYAYAAARYPLDVLKNAINNELMKHRIVLYDTTTLDFVDAQSEYELPTGIRGENLINVYESTVDDSNDNRWTQLNFHVLEAATGTKHTLVIDSRNVSTDNDIMLEYLAWCPAVYDADDDIDDIIPLERILAGAAATCELTRMRTYGSGSKLDIEMLNYYYREAEKAEMRFPVRLPVKRGSVHESGVAREARVEPPAKP